jgi:hypothetical protein
MKTVTVSKSLLNPIGLPGMGKSIELYDLPEAEVLEIRKAYAGRQLQVEFTEEEGVHSVKNLWPDPHDVTRLTLFI